jgi:GntR family transcriptional repressor for pyruvate dehydrogenase complex
MNTHNMTSPLPLQRQQLVDQVIQRLRESIVLGRVAPGTKLPAEPALMRQFGVGRSTVREAIRALAQAGLVEVRQGDGTYVRTGRAEDDPLVDQLRRARVVEVHEVRRALELEIARLAARRRTDDDLTRLRAALVERRAQLERGNAAAMLDADLAFHLGMARACGNAVLAELYASFATALRASLTELVDLAGVRRGSQEQHEALADAVAAGDADLAPRLAAAIIDQIVATVSGPSAPTH